jgi:hypothetical protein
MIRWTDVPKVWAIALTLALVPGCTFEQVLIGQVYTVITPADGPCPRLAWRFVVNAQRAINGSLSRDGQPPFANLSGQLFADDGFRIMAGGVEGQGTTVVTGRFTSQISTISVHGTVAGSDCDGRTFELRLGHYFAFQGGGGGGGG